MEDGGWRIAVPESGFCAILYPLSSILTHPHPVTPPSLPAMALTLHNPHSVLAALAARPADVLEVRLSAGRTAGAWADVERLAAQHRVAVRRESAKGRGRTRNGGRVRDESGGRAGANQATVREKPSVSCDELFADAAARSGGRGVWLGLDRLQDPHNVGAIFRTAGFFGIEGVAVTRDQSAPLSSTVYDVAAGGVESVPFAVETNLARTIQRAKAAGVWVLGTSERAERDLVQIDRDRPWLVVIGNEERGLRRLTLEACDDVCRIPPRGGVRSLNVSVAIGIVLAALCGGTN